MRFGFMVLALVLITMIGISHARAQDNNNERDMIMKNYSTAVFAGGCFWCMEPPFDKRDGVIKTLSGYAGGSAQTADYKQVSAGGTGHLEVIEVTYDPDLISYKELLEIYWSNIDPLDGRGQFCDKGDSYKSAIFYNNENEKQLAEQSRAKLQESFESDKIVTDIRALDTFYTAEDYHQDYYKNNPTRYKFYRWNCGRDQRLEKLWGDKATKAIKLF